MIPLAEAQAYVLDGRSPLSSTRMSINDALGCVTAQAITATEPIPSFANSAMDGYALQAADTEKAPARLEVVGAIMAGSSPVICSVPIRNWSPSLTVMV